MAERNPARPQLDFPQLTADIIAALRLTGQLGLFNMSDTVVPVISVGNVRPQTFSFSPITYTSSEIVHGAADSPAGNTVLADTGALGAGTYDLQLQLSFGGRTIPNTPIVIEHRNAANAVTLATLLSLTQPGTDAAAAVQSPIFGYVIGLNERLRIKSPNSLIVGGVSGSIFFTLRPTP